MPATSNAEHYARIVKEMATLRGLVRVGQEIQRLGQTRPGETTDLVDRAEQMVFELAQERVTGDFAHIHDLLKESFARIMHLYEAGVDITGVPSGFRELDKLTSGFQPGNLVIIAARPSMGKSALALCTAANLGVRHETPVALFTLEMSKAEVTQRLMCSEAKVESQRLRSGRLAQDDWPRLTAACDKLMKAPIYVDDTGSITMMELRSKARRLKSREPKLGLIIVDYLQLMTSGSNPENRVQEVSQISRQLKVLARDLEVPILALSQLSRAVEQRHDKRPILSDLRESAAWRARPPSISPTRASIGRFGSSSARAGFRVLALERDDVAARAPGGDQRLLRPARKPVLPAAHAAAGVTIRATANHKFLAFDGWRRLDELEPGSGSPCRASRCMGDGARTMSDPELALLGHLIGDGCTLPRHAIQYTTREPELAALVADLAERGVRRRRRARMKAERILVPGVSAGNGAAHARRSQSGCSVARRARCVRAAQLREAVPDEVFRQPVRGDRDVPPAPVGDRWLPVAR